MKKCIFCKKETAYPLDFDFSMKDIVTMCEPCAKKVSKYYEKMLKITKGSMHVAKKSRFEE